MLEVYAAFAEEWMAMPVIRGVKTASERFAGAVDTYCIEAMMQDGKALQAGTSHFLGQNFAKAFDCQFQNRENRLEYVWATSWGVSTRLIGALIMTHSDDRGLILPPRLAPVQVVIVPIFRKDEELAVALEAAERIRETLRAAGVRVKVDARETHRPGWKFNEYEVQGVPVRLAIGPRDVKNHKVEMARRDQPGKEIVSQEGLPDRIRAVLDDIQQRLFGRALEMREASTRRIDDYEAFKDTLDRHGGFVLAHWDGTPETEARIKQETKATIRCIPMNGDKEAGKDMLTGKPSERRVLFARAY